MAVTSYGTNDPLAVKLWSKVLAQEVLKNTWAQKFMGEEDTNVIVVKDETQKSQGDKITFGLRMQLLGDGVLGDGTLEGEEEALVTYSDAVIIDQLRHAVRSKGKMSEQRIPFSVRQEAMSGLRDWWADRVDFGMFNQLCGFTPTNTSSGVKGSADVRWTGNQAVIAPDANHIIRSDGSTGDDSITTTSLYSLSLLDKAVERARTLTPAIRPIRIGGKDMFVNFIHPYQVTDLRTNTNSGQWLDIQKAAMTGGEVQDNPIFDGSLGVYNGVIIHSDYRVTPGVNQVTATTQVANVRRAVFAGAQAGVCAYGRDSGPERFSWFEELFDYGNQLGVEAGMIWGLKKTVFNASDYANIVIASYAIQH
jgi:N4-gp56 family major capsid protein